MLQAGPGLKRCTKKTFHRVSPHFSHLTFHDPKQCKSITYLHWISNSCLRLSAIQCIVNHWFCIMVNKLCKQVSKFHDFTIIFRDFYTSFHDLCYFPWLCRPTKWSHQLPSCFENCWNAKSFLSPNQQCQSKERLNTMSSVLPLYYRQGITWLPTQQEAQRPYEMTMLSRVCASPY